MTGRVARAAGRGLCELRNQCNSMMCHTANVSDSAEPTVEADGGKDGPKSAGDRLHTALHFSERRSDGRRVRHEHVGLATSTNSNRT